MKNWASECCPTLGRCLAVLLAVAGAQGGALSAQEKKAMRAELDVFSGRPNPTWDLSAKEGEEFLKRLAGLPKAEGGAPREGLGYRGIIVTAGGQPVAGFGAVVISNGFVVGRRAAGDQKFQDKDRALERWLFRTAKGRLDKGLYDEINKEVQAD